MFKLDCVYYEPMRPEQYRAWCNKLNRAIKNKDCEGCGWYQLMISQETKQEVFKQDLEKIIKNE